MKNKDIVINAAAITSGAKDIVHKPYIHFTDNALKCIVEKAKKRKTGARALRSIIEDAMIDIMFEAPSKNDINSCLITEDVINNKSKPIYKLINKKSA